MGVALVGAGAVLEALLGSLGVLHVLAVQVGLAASVVCNLVQVAGVRDGDACLVIGRDDDVADDRASLGLGASLMRAALIGAGAVLEALLGSLGVLHILAVQVGLAASVVALIVLGLLFGPSSLDPCHRPCPRPCLSAAARGTRRGSGRPWRNYPGRFGTWVPWRPTCFFQ